MDGSDDYVTTFRKMKTVFMAALLGGFAALSLSDPAAAIVGGTRVDAADPEARLVHRLERLTDLRKGGRWEPAFRGTCSGVLVSQRIYLTAKHCVEATIANSRIRLSVKFLPLSGREVSVAAGRLISHPDSDIALVELRQDAPSFAKTVQIANGVLLENVNEIDVFGYGRTSGGSSPKGASRPKILHKVTLSTLDYDLKAPQFTVDQMHGRGACQGDSGGPAFVRNDKEYLVVGILSQTTYIDSSNLCSARSKFINIDFFWSGSIFQRIYDIHSTNKL